jgi:Fe-S cluster biogenesis protein NfuA
MEIDEQVERALQTCRPYLQADGGDVRFLRFKPESGVVEL